MGCGGEIFLVHMLGLTDGESWILSKMASCNDGHIHTERRHNIAMCTKQTRKCAKGTNTDESQANGVDTHKHTHKRKKSDKSEAITVLHEWVSQCANKLRQMGI